MADQNKLSALRELEALACTKKWVSATGSKEAAWGRAFQAALRELLAKYETTPAPSQEPSPPDAGEATPSIARRYIWGDRDVTARMALESLNEIEAGRASAKAKQAPLEPTNALLAERVRDCIDFEPEYMSSALDAFNEICRRLGVADGR